MIYGGKFFMTSQKGGVPESSFMVQGYTPTSGESNGTEASATYVFGWTLPNEWVWDFATRYSTSHVEEDDFNVWAPSTVIKVPLGERWKGHVEYFGVFTDGREAETTQHFVSPGAHFLVTPDFEIGVRTGWGLNDPSPNFFINAGIGLQY
jgi:hypothetical protein